MVAEIRSMKRKRSVDEPAISISKLKVAKEEAPEPPPPTPKATTTKAVTTTGPPACPLIQALHQYGLLESITTCLFPGDLLSLALSCKATYNAMFPRPSSLDNLLSRVQCGGNGMSARQRVHRKSSFFYSQPCTEFAQCSTVSRRQNTESRPCVSCKVTTCNECRIHCVYQSIYETASHPDELPNFSGFVLLDPYEVAILSPHHLHGESDGLPTWRNPATDSTVEPYHDQGFLDMALDSDEAATPERISDVLDVDLGNVSLTTWSASSQFGFPSPVLRSLCDVAERRKLFLCEDCFQDASQGYKVVKPALPTLRWLDDKIDTDGIALKECHCSLRSRILDRWQCVKCYEQEESTVKGVASDTLSTDKCMCRCGLCAERAVCMWCWGVILEGSEANGEVYSEVSASAGARND